MSVKRLPDLAWFAIAAVLLVACGDDEDAREDGGVDQGDGGDGDGDGDGAVVSDGGEVDEVKLTGTVRGPVGAEVTLRYGDEELTVTVERTAGVTDDYDATVFSFETGAAAGSDYEVTVEGQADGLNCRIYKGGAGTLPTEAGDLMVGCESEVDLVSRSSDDSVFGTFFDSIDPVIGGAGEPLGSAHLSYGEGRFVAFVSYAAGLEGSSDEYRQIYWRDRLTGQTLLVSATPDGDPGAGDSFAPAISADGLIVVFESYADDLVEGDANEVRDIFLWRGEGEPVERVSLGPDGVEADGESSSPTVSEDGSVIAFSTGASNLTGGVSGNATINVVRRDVASGENTLITANGEGEGVGGDRAMLSEDGNRLAFWSYSDEIAAGDGNGLWDIFVYQHDDGSYRRVSVRADGGERDQGDESTSRVVSPSISGDGRFVAYATTSTNVVEGDTNQAQDVFLVDLETDDVQRVSTSTDGEEGDADSPTGQGERIALSHDGAWVAFRSQATNFGAGGAGNVFLREVETGEMRAVTDSTSGTGTPSLSRTGAYLAFGAGTELDGRFDSTGLFACFTDIGRAWWWIE